MTSLLKRITITGALMQSPSTITAFLANSFFRRSARIIAACLISSTLACELVSGPEIESARVVERLTPADNEVTAGSIVTPSPAIRVTDERTGKPLAGITVEFRGTGGGNIEKPFTTTDATGFATAGNWVPGPRVGRYSLTAIAAVYGSRASFNVVVKPDVPARFNLLDTLIVGVAGETIEWLGVAVADRFGNATPGISVAFSIEGDGGAIERTSALTNSSGIATPGAWRLSSTPGEKVLVASAAGIESARVSVQALDPTKVTRYALDSVQQGLAMRSPQSVGLLGSTLIITTFDLCLCRNESGYYWIDIGYQFSPTFEPARITGAYRIESPMFIMAGRQIKNAGVDKGRISVVIERNDGDYIWTETWIFRPVSGGAP